MRHHHSQSDSDDASTFHVRERSTMEIVRRVSVYLKPYRGLAAADIACAVLTLAFSFAIPQLIGTIIDDLDPGKAANYYLPAAGLLAAYFLRDAGNSLRLFVNNLFEQNVMFDIRRDVFGRLQRLPVGYFDQRASGDLMTRVIEDVNSVERILIDGTEQGTVAILSVFGAVAAMIWKNPTLAAVAVIPFPILMGGALWYTLTAHRRYRGQRRAASAMSAFLMDCLQGVRQIKAFSRENHEDTRFAERADALRQANLGLMRVWSLYSPAMTLAASLGTGLVLWFGGSQVLAHKMSVGQLVGFLFFLGLFYEPVGRLHGLNQMLQAARAAGERVFDILDAPEERPTRADAPPQIPFPQPIRGDVRFENVSFSYGPNRATLKNVSLHAAPGEMIALVGPTGAGKSTLVNLLPAFYEAASGRITIDGHDTAAISLTSLREQISIVSQEAFLFNGTVRENILYGNPAATEEQMLAASRAANCHDFISHLPKGYDSNVGERGVKLSVGEKQRVSIARALLKNSPILILDEATASVDTATEKLIQEALERLMAHRTSFVIAHRLSTIRAADQILVLRGGEIVERGTHAALLERNGLYAKLSRIQNTTFIEEGFEKLEVVE
jgi:ATP-binding cassette, subfamily B, bacterial